jgi:ketose-bisphosphate aldolase
VPLASIPDLIAAATVGGYALGYFESWNLESLQGVLDAAEQTRSPMLVGVNGEFLTHSGRIVRERLHLYAALGKAAVASARVPCALIFNECASDAALEHAVDLGFNLVMPADPSATFEQYVRRTAKLVRHAHAHGAAVEAEVGELPCGASGRVERANGHATDPAAAADFVQRTGVDLLAVSVGNVHINVNGRENLDLDRLARIRERLPTTPLVLHGGTGISDDSLREAIALGVAKVNYGTYLKQRYLKAVREKLAADMRDPHRVLGMGGDEDVMIAGRIAVRDAVLERIELLGCCGKA